MKNVKLLLVGIGGYGRIYADAILDNKIENVTVVGIVDPNKEMYKRIDSFDSKIIYESVEDFYRKKTCDLAVIASPIQFHKSQSIMCLENGSNVLCEKPIAATCKDADLMIEKERKTGRFLAIGYQWSFSLALMKLKEDILNNLYGKPISMKTITIWPRTLKYYNRNKWAGKVSVNGTDVYDSISNNATAHHIHNMLWLLGSEMSLSERARILKGTLIRANDIETFDTSLFEALTPKGTRLFYAASHCVDKIKNPRFEFVFEKGKVSFNADTDKNVLGYIDDKVISYGDPDLDQVRKLKQCVRKVIDDKEIIPCTSQTAKPQIDLIHQLHSKIDIQDYRNIIKTKVLDGGKLVYIEGLVEKLEKSYEEMNPILDLSIK